MSEIKSKTGLRSLFLIRCTKFLAPIALNVEQGRQVAVIDANRGLRGDRGLGVKRNAGSGEADHVEIVGAVADSDRVGRRQSQASRDVLQRVRLGFPAKYRLAHLARQFSDVLQQMVGAVFVEAELFRDTGGERVKAAGHQRRPCAIGAHGVNQLKPAGGQRQACRDDPLDHRSIKAFQQGDAFPQRRLEGNLAVHRTRGDGRHMGLQTNLVGKFVDAFLVDHRRVHVGDEDFFPAIRVFVYDGIDGFGRQ